MSFLKWYLKNVCRFFSSTGFEFGIGLFIIFMPFALLGVTSFGLWTVAPPLGVILITALIMLFGSIVLSHAIYREDKKITVI